MDVSFTNVLEGARQYFQGIPAPSTAGGTPTTDSNLATSTSSSYSHGEVTASAAGPTPSATLANSVGGLSRNISRVPDEPHTASHPGNNAAAAVAAAAAAAAASNNSYWNPPGPVKPTRVEVPDTRPTDGSCVALEVPGAGSTLTEMQPAKKLAYTASSPKHLHQLQPAKTASSPPVYQQLNTVSRTSSYPTASEAAYQPTTERAAQSPAMVAPRTQYYPRYHHPDITKSTPLPQTQSSTYQSANAVPGSGVLQQPATRPSPVEQGFAPPQQPLPVANGYAATTSTHRSSTAAAVSPAPSHGNAHTHIPSPHNLPVHIPSPQNPSPQLQQQQQQPSSGTAPAFCPRGSPHMPPPSSAYRSTPSPREASPRHAPSPHASFQPHSPTYPPPPSHPPHSYSGPGGGGQHYPGPVSGYPQSSGYHQQIQKNSIPGGTYYGQTNNARATQSYATAPPAAASVSPTTGGQYHTVGKSGTTYNGVQDAVRPAYQNPTAGNHRTGSTHNLPPIAALSSYHYNRNSREPISKAQPMHRQQRAQPSASKPPGRVPDYPVNGSAVVSSASSMYTSRVPAAQQPGGYPRYATTVAPSHHASTATSTSVASNGGSVTTRASGPAPLSSALLHPGYPYTPAIHGTPEGYGYKEFPSPSSTAYPTSTVVSQSGSAPPQAMPTPSSSSGPSQRELHSNGTAPINRKRESPLDLSLRTIKTPADSTAQDDLEASSANGDKIVSSSNPGSRVQSRSVLSGYPGFPPARSPASGARAPTPLQTVRAPKVDFLPNFSSAPHHHQHHHQHHQQQQQQHHPHHHHHHPGNEGNPLRGSGTHQQQQLYAPPGRGNPAAPLPNVATFKKHATPPSSGYHRQPPSPATRGRYPVADPSHQEYAPDPGKYYTDRGKPNLGQTSPYARERLATSKRPASESPGYSGPGKQPRLDTWRMQIDQQIELRLSNAFHERQQRQEMNIANNNASVPNGAAPVPPPGTNNPGYENAYNYCDKRNYPEPKPPRNSFPSGIPYAVQPQPQPRGPGHPAAQPSYTGYRQPQGQSSAGYRVSSHPTGQAQNLEPPSNTGADKRVLSLLRNSLENKQQREEQLSNSQQPILANHNQQSFQNKVVAPVEPKTNIGRHNLSPFTAASLLERNSTTPPNYKFHVPRAVDSIIQEPSRSLYGLRVNSSATMPSKEASSLPRGVENQIHRDKDDGFAAILIDRIRTKAELKQVGAGQFAAKPTLTTSSQEISATPKDVENGASTSTPQSGSSGGSPPKLTREQAASLPPRRRLFSRTDEDLPVAATIPAPAPAPAKASVVAPRASGFRSSSETSVFDFRESDSEGEMPVLERQTLEEMRRDRRQLSKVQPPVPMNNAMHMGMASSSDLVKIELKENEKIIAEPDSFWSTTCDKFIEQLRSGEITAKKRGRRKKGSVSSACTKIEPDSAATTDTEVRPEEIKQEAVDEEDEVEVPKIKEEPSGDVTKNEDILIKSECEIKIENVEKIPERDSDELPLIERATRRKPARIESDVEGDDEVVGRKKRTSRGSRIKLEFTSGSESSSEESDVSEEFGQGSSVADRLRARKRSNPLSLENNEGMKLRSRDTTPHKAVKEKDGKSPPKGGGMQAQKAKPKPLFGDGSDFRPGWEEEVYVYKKSLRMPPRLITVSRPSRFHRLSTSLPDLDPGSPALSVSMDSTDLCIGRGKRVSDSDLESNCSFPGTGIESKIDDEEATSSTTMSCPTKTNRQTRSESNSIVDLLAQRVGTSKREQKRRAKEKLDKGPKILPKGSNEPELLATPSLAPLLVAEAPPTSHKTKGKTPVKNSKSLKPIKVTNSFLLGYFRKETVNNFRDAFKNNHTLPNEFSTFVLKSRTRTETRVLKKQATIREVFGEDRPASAPPMQNHGDTSQEEEDSQNEAQEIPNPGKQPRTLKQKVVSRLKSAGILRSKKAMINSKFHLLNPKKRNNLLKSLAKKKLQHIKKEKPPTTGEEEEVDEEEEEEDEEEEGEEEEDEEEEEEEDDEEEEKEEEEEDKTIDQSIEVQRTENNEPGVKTPDGVEVPIKKRLKLRTGRRKFRSGFDYIRKKKKPIKKDDALAKERKRQPLSRPSPESVADIQTEIRTWVIKKGVGETILHRAARLGYTDVAAYCLEKLDSAPSPKDNAGYTPLHEACSRGHLEIAKLLLAYGANVSESANGGIRPLHEAAENGATELVRLLLSYGADPLLATYSGQTPLMLASDTEAYPILEQHLDDVQGRPTAPWSFGGPSKIFASNRAPIDLVESGYSPLHDPPIEIPEPEIEDIEMEVSDVNLPVLYSLANDPDKWVLLQDLTAALRVKSRDALLRQVNPKAPSGPPAIAHREVMRELKLPDFLEQSRCCHLLSGGERINVRASKVTLIKYNEKVKSLLNVERVVISSR